MQTQWQDFLHSHTPVEKLTTHGCVGLTQLGLLCAAGADAKKFLQGQLTCNVDKLSPSQTFISAHCNPQGRIISLFRLIEYQDRYYFLMPYSMIPIAMAALKKYAVFFKVTLSDVSGQFCCMGYYGSQLQEYYPNIPIDPDRMIVADNLIIINHSGRFIILGHFNALAELWNKLSLESPFTTLTNWQRLDFEAGIPTIYPETSEKLLPHEINLPQLNAVSFEKGCYTGQEIIARMHYRAKAKSQLHRATVKIESPPQRGADIYGQSNVIGMIVDYAKSSYTTYELQLVTPKAEAMFLDANRQHFIELMEN